MLSTSLNAGKNDLIAMIMPAAAAVAAVAVPGSALD